MSAIENMVKVIFHALDIDVEEMKKDIAERIAMFERNVEILNATLIEHHAMLQRIEAKLDVIVQDKHDPRVPVLRLTNSSHASGETE
jgi:uncharacterized coiled-coil protein SlyX